MRGTSTMLNRTVRSYLLPRSPLPPNTHWVQNTNTVPPTVLNVICTCLVLSIVDMSSIFVIQNQNGHYLSKQQEWVDGRDRRILYRTAHRDEAVNVVFEHSSKDIYLRAQPLQCELDEQNQPVVEAGSPILQPSTTLEQDAEEEEAASQS